MLRNSLTYVMALLCQLLFSLICIALINLDSPEVLINQGAYSQVLGKPPQAALASSLAIVSGAFFNAYFVSKWKILLKGKYFWLRSIGASGVGELTFTVVAYLTEFLGVMPLPGVLKLMMVSYCIKLILNPLLIIPAVFVAELLKKLEGVDMYESDVNFNPFKTGMQNQENNYSKIISSEINKFS